MVDVAARKEVPVRWRAYSLAMKYGDVDVPESYATSSAHRALRVVEAVWADHADEPIGRLYTEIGSRFNLQQDTSGNAMGAAIEAAGLDPGYLAAAEDQRWDTEIRGSMDEAIALVGTDVGVPILVFRDGDRTAPVFGPVVSPTPKGDEALALWDHVVALAFSSSFYEVKRRRTGPPDLS